MTVQDNPAGYALKVATMQSKRFLLTVSIVFFLLGTALSVFYFSDSSVEKDIRSQYLKAGDFELIHQDKPLKLTDLKGQPVILYFGYTSCPDVCPLGLAVIRDVLKSSEDFSNVKVLFVTLDPARDTPEVLQQYTDFFHPNIIPLTGALSDIKTVIEAYGGFLRHHEPANEQQKDVYMVDHSAYYYLIDSNSELVRVIDHNVSAENLAASLRHLL